MLILAPRPQAFHDDVTSVEKIALRNVKEMITQRVLRLAFSACPYRYITISVLKNMFHIFRIGNLAKATNPAEQI